MNDISLFQIVVYLSCLYTLFSYWKKDLLWFIDRNKVFVFVCDYKWVTYKCDCCDSLKSAQHFDPFFPMIMMPVMFCAISYLFLGSLWLTYIIGVLTVIYVHKIVFEEVKE